MATGAARLKRKNRQQGGKRKTDRKRKTNLTLTGLLMEGVSRLRDIFPSRHFPDIELPSP
jgi:hypothetical protein